MSDSSARPLLLLDVDGVLNPYGWDTIPTGFAAHDVVDEADPVLVHEQHGTWISELDRHFEIMWATAWNDRANSLLGPLLGVGPFPVATMPPTPFPPEAKVAVASELSGHRPVVWIDDQHTELGRVWSSARAFPTLLVTCVPSVGLTRDKVNEIYEWRAAWMGADGR